MYTRYMKLAIEQAKKALQNNEIPVGAVIVNKDKKIFLGKNTSYEKKNPLLHAEMNVINLALHELNDRYLEECDMYITLEPCIMCAGAIANARIKRLYIGAENKKFGAILNGPKIFSNNFCNHIPEVFNGILENECQKIMKVFFDTLN